jgi:hypothetical protein
VSNNRLIAPLLYVRLLAQLIPSAVQQSLLTNNAYAFMLLSFFLLYRSI